ncbi:MAG: hypothetical protein NZM03_10370 [Limisphaera sp.]|nr:hypothetical protein [Limisphaera sp.]
MVLLFRRTPWQQETKRMLEGNGNQAEQLISVLTIAVVMLLGQILLRLPLSATLMDGDLVAQGGRGWHDAHDPVRPVSRLRLLMAQWVAEAGFGCLLVRVLGASALLFVRPWCPWTSLSVFVPGERGRRVGESQWFESVLAGAPVFGCAWRSQ